MHHARIVGVIAQEAGAEQPDAGDDAGRVVAVIAPHAGYVYSGSVAGKGFRLLRGILNDIRVHTAALGLGNAEAAYEQSMKYAGEREAFGRPIGRFQVIRHKLAHLATELEAARQAYAMAGVGPKDIDVAEVHDCFTIAEMMAYEDLGFAKPGEGKDLIKSKETYKEGSIPVNIDGGLLSK